MVVVLLLTHIVVVVLLLTHIVVVVLMRCYEEAGRAYE